MRVQHSDQTNTGGLRRQNLESGSLGTMGNLRFNADHAITLRNSRSGAYSRIGSLLANLTFSVSPAHPPAWSRSASLGEARENSRHIDNLISSLAAPATNARDQTRIVQCLAELSRLSKGDLINLPGGRESLSICLGRLERADLLTLHAGALGRPDAREALLEGLPADLHDEALGVLDQMAKALNQRLAQEVVQEPLSQVVTLLFASPMDGRQLEAPLIRLHTGLVMLGAYETDDGPPAIHMLDIYLQFLPGDLSETLLIALQPERLDAAKQAVSLIVEDLKKQQALAMLDSIRACLGREIHARARSGLEQLRGSLVLALHKQDHFVAFNLLRDLNALADKTWQAYGWLPDEMAEEVCALVKGCLTLFRDANSNPKGPLNAASLNKLDDITLAFLRHAWSLHSLGLELDLEAADEVALQRVAVLSQRAAEVMMGVLRRLASEPVDMPIFIRQLRNLSGLELQRTQQLTDLGQFTSGGPSVEARRGLARETCELMMDELFHTHQASMAHRAMRRMTLLTDLEREFDKIVAGMEIVIAQEDYKDGGMEIMKQLDTTRHLLNGIISEMDVRLSDLLHKDNSNAATQLYTELVNLINPDPAARALPSIFYRLLQEQYGVMHDPASGKVTVLVTDSMRRMMVPGLEMAPPVKRPHAFRTCVLPVDGKDKEFSVRRAFYEDAIERGSIALSARGAGVDGQPIRFTWPGRMPEQDRPYVMGAALDAFARVARSATEPLMRLMDLRKIAAAVGNGLQLMGMDSPFKADSSTVIFPAGGENLAFDVVRNEDGSFRMATTISFEDVDALIGVRADGTDVIVSMNPRTTSWAEVQYVLHVSSDAQRTDVIGLPQFRWYFDVESVDES